MKKEVAIKRLVPALIIGPASWLGPYIIAASLFLPILLQEIDAPNKINLLALFSTCGMIVAALSNMTAGYLSDRTYSKFGKRTPWLLGGSFSFMIVMILASFAHSVPYLLVIWMLGQVALNFIVAPMVAWIDMAPENGRGTASSAYGGLGMALGNNGFIIFGAMLINQFRLGFIIFGIITFLGTLIATLIVKEPSNLDEKKLNANQANNKKEKKKITRDSLKIFPTWKIGRDYYLALMGKLLQGVGNFAVTGYMLYIMTDFLGKSTTGAQNSIQIVNTIMLVFGISMGFLAGPLSDRYKLLKLPIVFSTLFLALGALSIFFLKNDTSIWIYGFTAGLGMGIWNSLDNLLNLEVIPDKNRVAFFLGVYNLGNTITQALAPVLAAAVISMFGFSAIFMVSSVFALLGGICIFSIKTIRR